MSKEQNLFLEDGEIVVPFQEPEPVLTLKQAVEALLFSSSEPLSLRKMRDLIELEIPASSSTIRACIATLQEEYRREERAFQIETVSEGFLLRAQCKTHTLLDRLHGKKRERLSLAAHEVLAIIAYQQPVTRAQIEAIRGVDSSSPLAQLVHRELVVAAGKLDAPGRPTLYKTTAQFLIQFGLEKLQDLPGL